MSGTAAIILAAGKSTRMKSDLPKVLHRVCGRPMLAYVLEACAAAGVDRMLVVVGSGKDLVMEMFADRDDLTWVEQTEQLGSGHAALVCEDALAGHDGSTLVIAGDMPLIRAQTLETLVAENRSRGEALTLATTILDDPGQYGRIWRDPRGRLRGIIEYADCTPPQRAIKEVNVSYYCYDTLRLFEALHRIKPHNVKGEYYITDTVEVLLKAGHGTGAIPAVPPEDAMGINSRADLAQVASIMQRRIQGEWMDAQVTIVDPRTTWIEAQCRIGAETVIHPLCHVGRGARIGAQCEIGPLVTIGPGEVVPDGLKVTQQTTVGATGS